MLGLRRIIVLTLACWLGELAGCTTGQPVRSESLGEPFFLTPEAPALAPRESILDAENPLDDFEANARVWYSLNQVFARANDNAGSKWNLDDTIAGRVGLGLAAVYFSGAVNYYSHELGHSYEERRVGVGGSFGVDWSDWRFPGIPEYDTDPVILSDLRFDDDAWFASQVNGLNQTTLDARFSWERSQLTGRLDWINGLAFLEGQFDHAWQMKGGLDEPQLCAPIFQLGAPFGVGFTGCAPVTGWSNEDLIVLMQGQEIRIDPDRYILMLHNRGINLSKREYWAQTLLANFLSAHTWQSIGAILQYIKTGNRSVKPWRLDLGSGLTLTPPLVSLYLTAEGGVYDLSSLLFIEGGPSLGISAAFGAHQLLGEGEANTLRIGARVHDLGWRSFTFSPYAYIDLRSDFAMDGYSVGLQTQWQALDALGVYIRTEYNDNDLLQSIVKRYGDGVRLVAGVQVLF